MRSLRVQVGARATRWHGFSSPSFPRKAIRPGICERQLFHSICLRAAVALCPRKKACFVSVTDPAAPMRCGWEASKEMVVGSTLSRDRPLFG
eukprot:288166-Rhodomonas_salina.1